MADNITVTSGVYTGLIATRDLGGAGNPQAQRVVLAGFNGTAYVDTLFQTALNGGGIRVFNMADQAVQGVFDEGEDVQDAPVPMGGRATLACAAFTELADAKVAHAAMTKDRKQIVMPFGAANDFWNSRSVIATNDTTDHTLITAAVSPVKRIPVGLRISNISATLTQVLLKDGTGGTVIDQITAPPNSAIIVNYVTGLWDTTAATLLCFACSVPVTSVRVSANGFNSR